MADPVKQRRNVGSDDDIRFYRHRVVAAGMLEEAQARIAELLRQGEAATGLNLWIKVWPEFRERVESYEDGLDGEKRESEDEDIQWAYENHSAKGVVESDAPSSGAASMLRWARDDFKAFMAHRRAARNAKQSAGDGERLVRQWTDKQKETIKGQLAKISKAAEELVLP